jgi:glycosyltransferase involved in cell wall biosynthesis
MKIGIVIPTYWRKDNSTQIILSRALNSILNQTHADYKVFLIGDKYERPDELTSIAKIIPASKIVVHNLPIAEERSKYTGHRLWCTGGINATNVGIDLCLKEKIRRICHLDHDDWWEPNHLFEIVKAFKEKDYAMVATQSTHINKQIFPRQITDPFYPKCNDLVRSSVCINYSKLDIKYRNVFEETGVDLPGDCDLWNRISNRMIENKLAGKLVESVTCNHLTEGYSKNN